MAIGFARCEVVHAGSGSSAGGLSAYIARSEREDLVTGEGYNFSHKVDDLQAHGVALPAGAPEWANDAETLWNRATEAETTIDRKTKELRFKKDAQVAKHMVLALPKELSDAERRDLTERFARETFADNGVAVEWAIHRPDGDSENHHAHLLVSTRRLEAEGFGKKARELNPSFAYDRHSKRCFVSEQDHWEHRWTSYQNEYFKELGLDLHVDPYKAVAEVHEGQARWIKASELQAANERRGLEAKEIARDPDRVIDAITDKKSTFTERDVQRYLHTNGVVGAEADAIKAQVMESGQLIPLYDRDTGKELGRYTTYDVRDHESRIMAQVAELRGLDRGASQGAIDIAAASRTLDPEQLAAFRHATGQEGVAIIEGRAGAGKSYTLAAVREAYELDGCKVIGLAPTNTVARDMKRDGFTHAKTAHMELIDLDRGKSQWDSRTVVIVDEAAMLDAKRYDRITAEAEKGGAKLVLVGDDRQLASIERGGIFSQVRDQVGAAEIREVRRQAEDWQREASKEFAAGHIKEGLAAYEQRGHVHWKGTTDEARAQLVSDWKAAHARDPEAVRFVYASTNKEVNALNAELRQARAERGELGPANTFQTKRGQIELSEGDRLQWYANDRKAGIYNGEVGTVTRIHPGGHITVQKDSGDVVTFKADKLDGFGHGYAGTVYRGQGKTQVDVYAFYDNRHGWNARTAYVGMTRHKADVNLYVGRDMAKDTKALARQMGRSQDTNASLRYATAQERSAARRQTQEAPKVQQKTAAPIQQSGADLRERIERMTKAVDGAAQKAQERPQAQQPPTDAQKAATQSQAAAARPAAKQTGAVWVPAHRHATMDTMGRSLEPDVVDFVGRHDARVKTHAQAIEKALPTAYVDPQAARQRLDQLITEKGEKAAGEAIRRDATTLGPLRGTDAPKPKEGVFESRQAFEQRWGEWAKGQSERATAQTAARNIGETVRAMPELRASVQAEYRGVVQAQLRRDGVEVPALSPRAQQALGELEAAAKLGPKAQAAAAKQLHPEVRAEVDAFRTAMSERFGNLPADELRKHPVLNQSTGGAQALSSLKSIEGASQSLSVAGKLSQGMGPRMKI